jgi:hypothetical protein
MAGERLSAAVYGQDLKNPKGSAAERPDAIVISKQELTFAQSFLAVSTIDLRINSLV